MASVTKYIIETVLTLNHGFQLEEHFLLPQALTAEEYSTKTEQYRSYSDLDYFECTCLGDGGSQYDLLVNKPLLQTAFFKFRVLQTVEAEEA